MTPPVRQLSSRAHALIKKLHRLAREAGAYRRLGEVWLEGDHLCRAWLDRGHPPGLMVIGASAWGQPFTRELALRGTEVVVVEDALLSDISSLESPAPIGMLVALPSASCTPQAGMRTVVLDRLQDPGNVGTILRSAAALGGWQVLALKGCAALWSPKVLRAAMGAHFGLHLVEGLDPASLDGLGVPLVATSSHAPSAIHELDLPDPCAWVFGHEGQGVAPELIERCGLTVRIPQPGGEESLNVASAASICLYESLRQTLRRPS